MRRLWLLVVAIIVTPSAAAQSCPPSRVALVLSGGGSKGLAHIGVLRVLDSLGIRPDLVVGSSMGAIIGALYASGYTGRQIDSLVRSLPISDLFRTYQPQAPRSLGPLQPLIVWEQGERRFAIQSASVSETEVNALVNEAMLRGNLLARGDFDSLPIPFRAVATDLTDRSMAVLESGDLARAVRASFAVPLLFAPESLGGRILADGGLAANLPVAVARGSGVDRVIVSDATERPFHAVDLFSPIGLATRLLDFLFQQPGDSLRPSDILIRPAVEGFASLDFTSRTLHRLVELGRGAAESTLARLPCLPPAAETAGSGLPRRIVGLTIESSSSSERLALKRLLGLGLSDTLEPKLLRTRVRDLARSEAYRAVWLTPGGAGDSISFRLALQRAPRRIAGLGLAYDNELGGRMWTGLVDRRLAGLALEGSSALFLGELRNELYLGIRRSYQLGRQLMTPTFTLRLGSESIRQFDSAGREIDPVDTRQVVAFLGVERHFARDWQIALGVTGHDWDEESRSLSTAGGTVQVVKTARGAGRVVEASVVWTGAYRRAALEAEASGRMGDFRLRPRVRVGWGERLPIQLGFPLGATNGFPGLHLEERRGDREAGLGLLVVYPLFGPVLARVDLAVGRSAQGGPLLDSDGWLGGARIGLGSDTPLGPVRFEYGRSTNSRGAVFVRLGRWF